MSTVLLTNELGSGFGHLNRLIAFARGLDERYRFVFLVPDPATAAEAVARAFGARATARQGVAWPAPVGPEVRSQPTHSFADVLLLFNFADPARLEAKVAQWRSIIDDIRPDVVVADFAPTLRIAAEPALPIIVVGNGFTIPPKGRPLPPMRPWQTALPRDSVEAETRILAAVNGVRDRRHLPRFAYLADLFSTDLTFACTFPAFDPYAASRTERVWQPFNVPLIEPGPPAAGRTGPAIFAYMPASHPMFDGLLEALNATKAPAHVYAPGSDPKNVAARCARYVGVLTRSADLARTLPQASLLIHHAGLGTAYAGLQAGTPQLLLPLNLEHLITTRGLIDARVGQGFSANLHPSQVDLRRGIAMLTGEADWMDRARVVAQQLSSARDPHPLQTILDLCARLLRSKQPEEWH